MGEKMVEKRFRVLSLSQQGNSIILTVKETQPSPSDKAVQLRPEDVIRPETEVEKVTMDMVKTMRRMGIIPTTAGPGISEIPFFSLPFQLRLTEEEYERIGKPFLGDIVVLAIRREGVEASNAPQNN